MYASHFALASDKKRDLVAGYLVFTRYLPLNVHQLTMDE